MSHVAIKFIYFKLIPYFCSSYKVMFSLPFELIPDNSVNKRRLPVATRQSTLGNFETCHKSGVGWYSFWEKSHFHGCKEWFIVTELTNKKKSLWKWYKNSSQQGHQANLFMNWPLNRVLTCPPSLLFWRESNQMQQLCQISLKQSAPVMFHPS